ncbi:hypothetical protein [Enterobacter hormaechei]|uniref:hypothetical protein n=1 Tax=Enterobacter hormaechei TaxID=158836 RepID=UPI00242F1891|nr:hypothetical protein [Enterobacter hormaechei]MEA5200612.1 hypothetical protein [Enterobacter hormaechei]WGA69593.1 hypothetical protein NFL05_16415 [Enterobacter hormaechei]WGA74079.1 hypothetical protein NFL06_16420 [Enterobacter hormaechei]
MNTKRVTAMRHRRLALKRSEKEKEQEMVIEAVAYAAIATANAIMKHEEVAEQNYPRIYLTGHGAHEAILRMQGVSFESILKDKMCRETGKEYKFQPYELKLHKSNRSHSRQQLVEMITRYYKSSFKPTASHEVVMREVPKMSVEKSQAISRRMFARTADDMAQELYDDAE